MEELDMSRSGNELFLESAPNNYNSYRDVNQGQLVGDPIDTGVNEAFDVADQGKVSDKEFNFKALREQASKLKQESEYWRGQAEALSKSNQPPAQAQQDDLSSLDWDDGRDVRRAFDALRQQNETLRDELRDAITGLTTKTKRSDWDAMVTQHVPELTQKNPIFAEMIQKASNPYEAAYLLAELNSRSAALQHSPTQSNGNAQRALSNAQKPQTLASVGGSGNLGAADYYASMSDEDFNKIAARNLGNI